MAAEWKKWAPLVWEWDEKLSEPLALALTEQHPLGPLRPYLAALEVSCHNLLWLLGSLILLWFSSSPDAETFFLNLLLAVILDIVVVAVLKSLINRPGRPTVDLGLKGLLQDREARLACPSGSASRAVLGALLLGWSLHLPVMGPLLTLWALGVCGARVTLGRAGLVDVVLGGLVGWLQARFIRLLWLSPASAALLLSFFQ